MFSELYATLSSWGGIARDAFYKFGKIPEGYATRLIKETTTYPEGVKVVRYIHETSNWYKAARFRWIAGGLAVSWWLAGNRDALSLISQKRTLTRKRSESEDKSGDNGDATPPPELEVDSLLRILSGLFSYNQQY